MTSASAAGMHKPRPEVTLSRIAQRNEGVFHRDAATKAGVTRHQLSRLADSGFLRHPKPRVYVLEAFPPSWLQEVAVAYEWGLPDGVISHRTAAGLWRLRGFAASRPIELTSATYLRSRADDVIVHRVGGWHPGDTCELGRLRVTSPVRTLIDLAASISFGELRDALDEALVRELVTIPRLMRRLEALGTKGRSGTSRLVRLIREFTCSDLPPQSVLERRFLQAVRKGGLPDPVLQHRVDIEDASYRIDFAYPGPRIAIELDGWRFHGGREAWQADVRRANALVAVGWRVIRGTWRDIHEDPHRLLSQIADVLRPQLIQG